MGRARECPNFWLPPINPGSGRTTNFKSGRYIHRIYPNQIPLNIFEKRERGRIQGLPNFWGTPIISGTGKATDFKFCTHIQRVDRNKGLWKILGKVAIGIVRESRNFSGHPYIGRIVRRAVIFDSTTYLFYNNTSCTCTLYRQLLILNLSLRTPIWQDIIKNVM